MAITLKVTGNGHFRGSSTNLSGYTVTEDSTPIEGSDSSGGTGTIDFQVVESAATEDTILLLNDTVDLSDGSNGKTQGIVNTVSGADSQVRVTADSRLNLFVATVNAAPYTGTLGGYFTYMLGLVGITTGFSIDSTITGRTVTYQGFQGTAWDYVKQVCIAEQVEVSLVSNNIVMRPLRGRIAEALKDVSESWTVTNTDLAQSVQVYYYNNTYVTNSLVYPQGGWNKDVDVFSVDAGKTLVQNIPITTSLVSLVQPTIQTTVSKTDTTSTYSVSGNDGLPIVPAQWTADGGSLTVAIGSDGQSIDLTVVAPTLGSATAKYAPFSIGVASSTSDYYSSLRIRGTGTQFTKTLLTVPTGVPATKTATVVGATIDNIYIDTLTKAYNVGMRAAGKWAAPVQTINFSATVINRRGDKGDLNYTTFANFDTQYAGKTFAQFDTLVTGQTYTQWNAAQLATVQDNFENQAFGNVAGARVYYRSQWYRIRNATITESIITYTAERDSLFSDFDTLWAGKTFAQFDTKWTGKTFADMATIPLWQ